MNVYCSLASRFFRYRKESGGEQLKTTSEQQSSTTQKKKRNYFAIFSWEVMEWFINCGLLKFESSWMSFGELSLIELPER